MRGRATYRSSYLGSSSAGGTQPGGYTPTRLSPLHLCWAVRAPPQKLRSTAFERFCEGGIHREAWSFLYLCTKEPQKNSQDAPWVGAVLFINAFALFLLSCTRPFAPAHERQGAGCHPEESNERIFRWTSNKIEQASKLALGLFSGLSPRFFD